MVNKFRLPKIFFIYKIVISNYLKIRKLTAIFKLKAFDTFIVFKKKLQEFRKIPKGIIIIKWDNELGAVLVAKYPKNLNITTKLLTNIYASHRINNLEPNFATITLTDSKVISFFSGFGENIIVQPNYIIALILRRDEKPIIFKDILKKGAAQILSNLDEKKYEKIFPTLFKEMTKLG